MTHGKARPRALGVSLGTAVAMTLVGLFGIPAQAAPRSPDSPAAERSSAAVKADQVSGRVGADTGGYYVDMAGRAVVNVTNQADARTVRSAGLRPKLVDYQLSTLTSTKSRLDKLAGIRDTAWGIDTSTNQVVVTISDAAPQAGAAKLRATAAKYGDKVRIERITGHLEVFVRGGDAIQNGSARCSAGFNVLRGGELMVLTAGHCTELGGTWSPMGGTVVESDSPGADSGLISNPSGDGPSEVNTGQSITSIAAPAVGQSVTKSGSTTGVTSGTISAVDQTVNFDVGVIYHLFATDVDSASGDSGGPGYDGSIGLGTLTGGNATTTYFYPAHLEFSDYGLTLP